MERAWAIAFCDQERACPLRLELSGHAGVLFTDEDEVTLLQVLDSDLFISPLLGLFLILAKVVNCAASCFF